MLAFFLQAEKLALGPTGNPWTANLHTASTLDKSGFARPGFSRMPFLTGKDSITPVCRIAVRI